MNPHRSLAIQQHIRFVTALAVALAACQRRDLVDVRSPLSLGTNDDWAFATHPALSMSADQLRDMTARLFASTGRFNIVPATTPTAARALAHVVSVDAEPEANTNPPVATVNVRVRLEYVPPKTDDSNSFIATATATSRGPRDQAAATACETALGRAIEQVSLEVQAAGKSTEELVADLSSPDPHRVEAAVEHLAARRHPAAYDRLLKQLHEPDPELSLHALSALVSYDDAHAVPQIIEEAERRDFPFFIEALYALGSLGGEEAEGYLYTIAKGHPDPRAQNAASEALVLLHKRAETARPSTAALPIDGAIR